MQLLCRSIKAKATSQKDSTCVIICFCALLSLKDSRDLILVFRPEAIHASSVSLRSFPLSPLHCCSPTGQRLRRTESCMLKYPHRPWKLTANQADCFCSRPIAPSLRLPVLRVRRRPFNHISKRRANKHTSHRFSLLI